MMLQVMDFYRPQSSFTYSTLQSYPWTVVTFITQRSTVNSSSLHLEHPSDDCTVAFQTGSQSIKKNLKKKRGCMVTGCDNQG